MAKQIGRKSISECISVFGKGNFETSPSGLITYKSVFNDEASIVIRTNDIISILDPQKANSVRYVLVTGPHKGIYIEPWQFIKVSYQDKTKTRRHTSVLRLNREYSTSYWFPNKEFDNKPKESVLLWQDLLTIAKQQGKEKIKVKML